MPTCESDAMMLMAPMSCRISSAAMVSARIRDSAKATSSERFLDENGHFERHPHNIVFGLGMLHETL